MAICLRSAGAQGFDRNAESLTSIDEIDLLFRHAADSPFPKSVELKVGEALDEAFPNAHWPEISCTVPTGRSSLAHVVVIWVDPYTIAGRTLHDHVCEADRGAWSDPTGCRTVCCGERRDLYDELAKLARTEIRGVDAILARPSTSPGLSALLHALQERALEYQLDRYLRYLHAGTLTDLPNHEEESCK